MLKQNKRLKGRLTVQAILNEGIKENYPIFALFKIPNQAQANRYAVLVGKKLEKSAVKRNTLRRRLYEAIRLVEKEKLLQKTEYYDTVLLARSACKNAKSDQIKSILKSTSVLSD